MVAGGRQTPLGSGALEDIHTHDVELNNLRVAQEVNNLLQPEGFPQRSSPRHAHTKHSFSLPSSRAFWGIFFCAQIVVASISLAALIVATRNKHDDTPAENVFVRKLAFGSCSERSVTPDFDTIWTKAIIPSQPDAWIWVGDLAYMDNPFMDCSLDDNKNASDCSCEVDFLRHPPYECLAGDFDNALSKMRSVLNSPGYGQFLNFMCPDNLMLNKFPPNGRDPVQCPRRIMGVYDDHDYGWNNGDRRLPRKDEMKQVYLDAIGELSDSPRRSSAVGINDWVTLNSETPEQSIDVILLDGRYDRAPLPCFVKRTYCAQPDLDPVNQALCKEFLGSNNAMDPGSCCKRDDDIANGWCKKPESINDANYASACDPTSPNFGSTNWAVDSQGNLQQADMSDWRQGEEESGFCEVLGMKQRAWLDDVLEEAHAPVQLFVSGSVLFGSPDKLVDDLPCSGDDWDCFRPAQVNLLHRIASSKGCTIVLTGDYHVADIKRVDPADASAVYAQFYRTSALKQPVYQVMASGLSTSTAVGLDTSCGGPCCSWAADTAGLRVDGECAVYGDPNFGMLEFDWKRREVSMKVYRGDGGGVANGAGPDGKPLQLTISLDTCMPVG